MHVTTTTPPAPPIGAALRLHLAAAAEARGRGDHALADLRAVIAEARREARA